MTNLEFVLRSYWKITINNDNENSESSLHAFHVVGIVPKVKLAL